MEDYITTQHHYYTLDYYLKRTFNSKVFKVSLNGNFTCPNRDGTLSTRGCIFCSAEGSGDYGGKRGDPLKTQFDMVKDIIHKKWPNAKYIAYFQANTNTYKPINELKSIYEEAINLNPNICALAVATRPDAISIECMDYLAQINKKIKVFLELGFQTSNEETAKLINRGYSNIVLEKTVNELHKRNIDCIVHIINGLPFETENDMYNTIKYLNKLNINGIKIHSLFILKDTELATMYLNNEFKLLTLDEYVKITANQLGLLNKDVVIHRINGDAPKDLLIAPTWSLKKLVVMNEIDKYMKEHNIYQGSLKIMDHS